MIISIDFSITSPGVCVIDNEKSLNFACFPYRDIVKDHIIESLEKSNVFCGIRERNEDKTSLITQSRFHTGEAEKLTNEIIKYLRTLNIDKNNILIFEGFSFNSGGNRLAQISGYQFVARSLLLKEFSKLEHLFVYAPQSVKSVANAAKKGMNKTDMMSSFLNHENYIPGLRNSIFYQNLSNTPEMFKNIPSKRTKKIVFQKPIDDIIDSYWLLKTYLFKESIEL